MSVYTPEKPRREGAYHSTATVRRARELWEGGWSVKKIKRLLASEGTDVAETTIRRWVVPGWAERAQEHGRRHRANAKATRPMGDPRAGQEFQAVRARTLVEVVGLTPRAAARLMRFDFKDESWTANRVREAVGMKGDNRPRKTPEQYHALPEPEPSGLLPIGPFREWLAELAMDCAPTELAASLGMGDRRLRSILAGEQEWVSLGVVDAACSRHRTMRLDDLYPIEEGD